ncbi:MAG TPA: hypothetical protein VMS08_03745, partial [Candidatus Saccharimonadia bacterium]|nr:hypothetical protein [Candidatus Saccharimonadia bacterium]
TGGVISGSPPKSNAKHLPDYDPSGPEWSKFAHPNIGEPADRNDILPPDTQTHREIKNGKMTTVPSRDSEKVQTDKMQRYIDSPAGSHWIDVKGNFNRDFNQPSSSPGSGGGGQTPASSPGGQTPDFAGYAKDTADIESHGGTMRDRPGSKFHGKYQMGPGYGGKGTEEQRFARGTELNRQQLKRSLGREPTHTELYMAHQQGAGAAGKLGGHPDRTPHELGVRDKNITDNHGNPNRPAKDFVNKWAPKFHEPGVGGPGPSPLPLAT